MKTRVLFAIAVLGLCSGPRLAAQGQFSTMSLWDAERQVSDQTQINSSATIFIWSDKYVYQPNEVATLRWTVRPNNDFYPYTIVAYRQNNQTGVKTYFPNGTSEVSDIFGNTPGQGFLIARLPQGEKQVLIGAGGTIPAAQGQIPNELGMHTFVVQVRDYTGTRIVRSAYMKIGVVDGFEDMQGDIQTDRTLVNTKAYRLQGLVHVRGGATLTIEPGTFIIGQPGSQPPSALLVTQTGRIVASGTRSRPIIFTSSLPFGQRNPGDWGGLILLGSAPTNWPTGFGNIEGLTPSDNTRYGGTDPTHNCGTLRYVRVEFSGVEFAPNSEVNSITWGGCGSATVSEFLQASYGNDDTFEWFGGNNGAKYLIGLYARDDYFDGQIGWTGRVQHALAVSNQEYQGNRGFEMDNNEVDFGAQPLSHPQFYNVTFVGAGDAFTTGVDEGAGVAAVFLRRGAAGDYNNLVLFNWVSNGYELRDDATLANLDSGQLTSDGVLLWNNGVLAGKANTVEGQTNALALPFLSGQRGQARNILLADPLLRRPLDFSNPDFRPRHGSPIFRANWVQPPDDGFFDQWATWIGAFGEVDWTEEWANFLEEGSIAP